MGIEIGSTPLSRASYELGRGGLLNVQPYSFRRTRSKIGMANVGFGACTIVGIGDSIMRGTGAGASGSAETDGTGGYSGMLDQMATQLAAIGITASSNSVFGYGGYEQNFSSYDNRITVTGSFNRPAGGGIDGLGGQLFQASASGTVKFAPVVNVDTIDVYYLNNGASLSYGVDGGSTTTVNTTNNNTIQKISISCGSLGTHYITINWVSGTSYVCGFVGRTSTVTSPVTLINGAWHGSKTGDWTAGNTGSYWNFDKMLTSLSADCVIWELCGTNDWSNSVSVSTFTTNLTTLIGKITALATVPDILFITPPPRADGSGLESSQQQYVDAVIQFAITNGLPVYDRWRRYGSQFWGYLAAESYMEGFGMMNSDHIHPTKAAYSMDARELLGCILPPGNC